MPSEGLSEERLAFIEKHSGQFVPLRELIAEVRRLQAQAAAMKNVQKFLMEMLAAVEAAAPGEKRG